MAEIIDEGITEIVQVIDELRNNGLGQVLELPRICVIGAQSAGKSSVLESLVGIDFLPKAAGLCTRCPLEIRMRRDLTADTPFAFFQDDQDSRIEDFTKVTEGIIKRTSELAGTTTQIVDKPIVLNIHQRDCADLTLIDLPGITRVAVKDQTADIEQVTRQMSLRYIKESRTIILAVLPANNDVTNADSLQLARRKDIDPDGLRTIGVVTKIDLFPNGTNPADVLEGKTLFLKNGYVGVRNRDQGQIDNKMSISESIENEQLFISQNSTLEPLKQRGLLGTNILRSKLTEHLQAAIREHLPAIRNEVHTALNTNRKLLEALPTAPQTSAECATIWSGLQDSISSTTSNILSGQMPKMAVVAKPKAKGLSKTKFRPLYIKLYDGPIATADPSLVKSPAYFPEDEALEIYHEYNFSKLPGFFSESTFQMMCAKRFEALREPSEQLVDDVHEMVSTALHTIINLFSDCLPRLKSRLLDSCDELLDERRVDTQRRIKDLIDCETSAFYSPSITLDIGQHEDEDEENEEIERKRATKLRDLAIEYMEETRIRLRTSIPRVVHTHYVDTLSASLQGHLSRSFTLETVASLLKDIPEIARERKRLKDLVDILNRSQRVLKEYSTHY